MKIIKDRFDGFKRFLLLTVISLFLGFNIYFWNAYQLVGNAMPMPLGYSVAVVLSGSMEPELSVNDLVFIHQEDNYEVGDVVIYQSGDELIIHRIININEEAGIVETKGDANNASDNPIFYDDIKGKMIGCIPWIGHIVQFLHMPIGILIVLLLAFVLLERSYRYEYIKDNKELERIKKEIRYLRAEKNDDKN